MGNIFDAEFANDYKQIPIASNNINSLDKNDKLTTTNLSEFYSNMDSFETTIISITEYDNSRFRIECNPASPPNRSFYRFYLKKSHPNFIHIYNNIKVDQTYKIIHETYSFWSDFGIENIVDILPCVTHNVTNVIKGFLNIKNELNIHNYHEIVTDDTNNKIRLLITDTDMNNIIFGEKYSISYVKEWKANLYLITKYELCND
jgi:hypothetical protein